MSPSWFSISRLVRLRWKLRFPEGEEELPNTTNMVRFFIVITLQRPRNCEYNS